VTTLLDHTCGHAVLSALDSFRPIATLDLRIDYLRAAEPGLDIVAYAHCYKLTRSVAFVRAIAYDADRDDPVATAQATFMLDSSRPGWRGRSTSGGAKQTREELTDGETPA
jgi:acyl-coenzyme A thioesterase PaaI-like protein